MALTPLKQRPATAYRRIPIPNGSVLLVPNRSVEPGPGPGPEPFTPAPSAQWDVNTRGRTDNDLYEHVNGVVETSTGATLDQTGSGDAMRYSGTGQYTEVVGLPVGVAADFLNNPYTLAVRFTTDPVTPTDFQSVFGIFQNGSGGKRIHFTVASSSRQSLGAHAGGTTNVFLDGGAPSALTPGQEHVLVQRREAGNVFSLWLDGVEVNQQTVDPGDITPVDRIGFAARTDGDLASQPWYLEGTILWAAIWEEGLTDAKIGELSATDNPFLGNDPDPGPEPPQGAIKWNPGSYMLIKNNVDSTIGRQDIRFGYYDEIASVPEIVGVQMYVRWEELERPDEGDYGSLIDPSFGLGYIKRELDYLHAMGKKLWIRLDDQDDGGSDSLYWWFPDYIVNNNWATSGNKGVWHKWDSAAYAKYNNMLAAYGAEFDDHPALEGISMNKETALGSDVNSIPGYSAQGHIDGLKAIATAAKAAFPTTNVMLNLADLSTGMNDTQMSGLVQWCVDNAVAIGGPDLRPQCVGGDGINGAFESAANQKPNAYKYQHGNVYVGQACVGYSVETSELGNAAVTEYSGYPHARLVEYARDYLGMTHIFWARRDFTLANGSYQHLWESSMGSADSYIEPNIIADPLVNTGYPSKYPQ